jgi:hypothetical protein
VYTNSGIRDDITISDPLRNGTTGYLTLSFDVTGTKTLNYTSNLNANYPSAQGILSIYSDSQFIKGWGFSSDTTIVSPVIHFTYGSPFELFLSGGFFIRASDNVSPTLQIGDRWSLNGSVDFNNTINLSELSVFSDIEGTLLASGFELTANSGTMYPISSVPIPAAAWLFGSGLFGLFCVTRRKKSL